MEKKKKKFLSPWGFNEKGKELSRWRVEAGWAGLGCAPCSLLRSLRKKKKKKKKLYPPFLLCQFSLSVWLMLFPCVMSHWFLCQVIKNKKELVSPYNFCVDNTKGKTRNEFPIPIVFFFLFQLHPPTNQPTACLTACLPDWLTD